VAQRTAFFPGERIELEASSSGPGDVRWTGGGTPATGEGSRFATTFARGGRYTIRAEDPVATALLEVTVCPIDEWLARAAGFFGPSLDLERVQVKASPWVLGAPKGAWTCNTIVRFKRPTREQDLPSEATLIHELGHVWEHRAGQAQLLSGVVEQVKKRFRRDPYDYGGPAGVRAAQTLTRFSKESQAQVITELWKAQNGFERDRKEVSFSTPGYVDDLRRLVRAAGIGATDPTRRTLAGSIDSWVARLVNVVLARLE
jgi:hypothetical protein